MNKLKRLNEVCIINPRRPAEIRNFPNSHLVTFVPMPAVDAGSGSISNGENKPLGEVQTSKLTPVLAFLNRKFKCRLLSQDQFQFTA